MCATTCAARASARRWSRGCWRRRRRSGFRQMVAVIGDSDNVGSIGVHASLGFQRAGLLRASGLKFGRWVDTVFMQRALGRGDADIPPDLAVLLEPEPAGGERVGPERAQTARSPSGVAVDGQNAAEKRDFAAGARLEQAVERERGRAARHAAGAARRRDRPAEARSARPAARPARRPPSISSASPSAASGKRAEAGRGRGRRRSRPSDRHKDIFMSLASAWMPSSPPCAPAPSRPGCACSRSPRGARSAWSS